MSSEKAEAEARVKAHELLGLGPDCMNHWAGDHGACDTMTRFLLETWGESRAADAEVVRLRETVARLEGEIVAALQHAKTSERERDEAHAGWDANRKMADDARAERDALRSELVVAREALERIRNLSRHAELAPPVGPTFRRIEDIASEALAATVLEAGGETDLVTPSVPPADPNVGAARGEWLVFICGQCVTTTEVPSAIALANGLCVRCGNETAMRWWVTSKPADPTDEDIAAARKRIHDNVTRRAELHCPQPLAATRGHSFHCNKAAIASARAVAAARDIINTPTGATGGGEKP